MGVWSLSYSIELQAQAMYSTVHPGCRTSAWQGTSTHSNTTSYNCGQFGNSNQPTLCVFTVGGKQEYVKEIHQAQENIHTPGTETRGEIWTPNPGGVEWQCCSLSHHVFFLFFLSFCLSFILHKTAPNSKSKSSDTSCLGTFCPRVHFRKQQLWI